jgi:hypothetical protein
VKSWTRTLNLDDAHTLLAEAKPGLKVDEWASLCYGLLPALSMARRRELIRILRDGYLDVTPAPEGDGDPPQRILPGLFLRVYSRAPAVAQVDLVQLQWALSHPLSLIAAEALVAPALASGRLDIPLDDVEALVAEHLATGSAESKRKTRTVLLGALEGIGVLITRGTGQHRALRAAQGQPHPLAFGYLVLRDLEARSVDAMMASEVAETSLAARLTQCDRAWARHCVQWNLDQGVLVHRDDEIAAAP